MQLLIIKSTIALLYRDIFISLILFNKYLININKTTFSAARLYYTIVWFHTKCKEELDLTRIIWILPNPISEYFRNREYQTRSSRVKKRLLFRVEILGNAIKYIFLCTSYFRYQLIRFVMLVITDGFRRSVSSPSCFNCSSTTTSITRTNLVRIDSDQFVKNEEMELKKVQKDKTTAAKLHNQHKSYFYFRFNNFLTVLS